MQNKSITKSRCILTQAQSENKRMYSLYYSEKYTAYSIRSTAAPSLRCCLSQTWASTLTVTPRTGHGVTVLRLATSTIPVRQILRSLPSATLQMLLEALVHSRLDYGNGVLVGLPAYLMCRLQSVLQRLLFYCL